MAEDKSLLEKLDEVAPIKSFDAFPKLPPSLKKQSRGGAVLTIFVVLLSVLLVLNDVVDYYWGWTDYEFSVDPEHLSLLDINVDLVVNMPCQYLSVDLRDVVGDRLHLSNTFRRDGTLFDVRQAETLDVHRMEQSLGEIVTSSRRSRGFIPFFKSKPTFKPTYNYQADGSACRVYGSVKVKKVTGNLHITTAGHGYAGADQHIDHSKLNLSHVITEFSFGPYFPDIVQPLDYSLEVARENFVAYQYFISVVPTTYVAPRSKPLRTNQYSVTHYVRPVAHGRGTPGIFFKFDLDPLAVEVVQRTTTFTQFMIRVVGVIGGVWVCFGWGIKVATKVTDKVGLTSDPNEDTIVAESTGRKKRGWGGSNLHSRRANAGEPAWIAEGGSQYSSYANTPVSATFSSHTPASPYFPSNPGTPSLAAPPRSPYLGAGSRLNSSASPHFPPSPLPGSAGFPHHTPPPPASAGPYTPHFPPSPLPGQPSGFPSSPLPGRGGFPGGSGNLSVPGSPLPPSSPGVGVPPPPRRTSTLRNASDSSTTKKDD